MSMYILLLTMTPEGQRRMLDDPESLLAAGESVDVPGVRVMGLYGVLGNYDFVSMVEAPDNDSIARFSLDLGVRGGVHVTTLPAIPITRLETVAPPDVQGADVAASPEPVPVSRDGDRDEAEEPPT